MDTYQENFLTGSMGFLSAILKSPPGLLKRNLKTWPSLPYSALALSPSLCLGCPIPGKSLKQESPSVPAYAVKSPQPLPTTLGEPHAASPQHWAQLCTQHQPQVLLMLDSCRPQKENLSTLCTRSALGNLYLLNSNQWIEKNSTYSLISISIIAPL